MSKKAKITPVRSQNSLEIISLGKDKFNIAIDEIETVEDIFDEKNYEIKKLPNGGEVVSWGKQNQLPYGITKTIATDEVMSANKLFNVQSLYGLGLRYQDVKTGLETTDEEIRRFTLRNAFSQLFLEQATDMKYFYFSAMLIVLSNDRKKIAAVHHLEACNVRFEKADDKGHINNIYYGDWKAENLSKIIKYPLLSMRDPFSDLLQRTGKETITDPKRKVNDKETMFAIVTKFPTPGFAYYPSPYYLSVFKSGWFEIKHLAAVYKKAKLTNFASIRYLVTIEKSYWEEKFRERNILTNPTEQKKVRDEVIDDIKKFVTGAENTGKLWVTGCYTDTSGKQVSQVTITKIDTSKEGGDFSEENQEACNMICYADGIHPNMVGAVPGKSQSNNSGSDKRELFTLKQSLETPFRDIMLIPHELIIQFNGWADKVKPVIPMALLSTLDKHTDSLTVTKN